jgi:serine phosphatase RsbU (regulator of sigma subunit)
MTAATKSPTHRAEFGEKELVVGTSRQADTVVYVSEYMSDIREAALRKVLRRVPRIVLLAVVTAIVVNLVFLRMAARPLRHLVDTVRKIGSGQLGIQTRPFGSEEFAYLAEAVNHMSRSLDEMEQTRRKEMVRARRIQEQLLPDETDLPGLAFSYIYKPAEEVAGDYYDIVRLRDGTLLVCIADVTGHGVPAALTATMLKAFLMDASEYHSDPAEILEFINHRLAVVCHTESFVTMFVARWNPDAKTLQYASAGHETGLLLTSKGGLIELPSTGLVLGIVEDAAWETATRGFDQGDQLLLVTDGVTEAMNPAEELFGRQRLAAAFEACKDIGIHEAVRQIGQTIADHCADRPQTDDLTLLAFKVQNSRAVQRVDE